MFSMRRNLWKKKKEKNRIARPLASALIFRKQAQKDFLRVIEMEEKPGMSKCREARHSSSRSHSSILVSGKRKLIHPRSHSSFMTKLKTDRRLWAHYLFFKPIVKLLP